MFGGDKTGISWLFFKPCEQVDHQPAMQHHLKKVEAIEVLDCTKGARGLQELEKNTLWSDFL